MSQAQIPRKSKPCKAPISRITNQCGRCDACGFWQEYLLPWLRPLTSPRPLAYVLHVTHVNGCQEIYWSLYESVVRVMADRKEWARVLDRANIAAATIYPVFHILGHNPQVSARALQFSVFACDSLDVVKHPGRFQTLALPVVLVACTPKHKNEQLVLAKAMLAYRRDVWQKKALEKRGSTATPRLLDMAPGMWIKAFCADSLVRFWWDEQLLTTEEEAQLPRDVQDVGRRM